MNKLKEIVAIISCAIFFPSLTFGEDVGRFNNTYSAQVSQDTIKKCIYICRGQDKLFGDCSESHCGCGPDLTKEQKTLSADLLYPAIFYPTNNKKIELLYNVNAILEVIK